MIHPWPLALLVLLVGCGSDEQGAATPVPASPPISSAEAMSMPFPQSPPRPDTIDLRRIGHAQGSIDAPVIVVEFSDFGCPFCAMFSRGTYPELYREFIETGRVQWIFVPFVMGNFPNGAEAARAGECAAEQDRFWEMKERIYAGQNEWKSGRNPTALFAGYAREVGLDDERFSSCYRENRGRERTRVNNQAAAALGVRATPTFLIDGRLAEGAVPAEQFRALLDRLSPAD